MSTVLIIAAGWVAVSIAIGVVFALIRGKERERSALLEQIYDDLAARKREGPMEHQRGPHDVP